MPSQGCRTCEDADREAIEEVGVLALEGEISWREAARRTGYSHPPSLKNHMEKHFMQEPLADPSEGFIEKCEEVAKRLEASLPMLPPELAALRLVQIHNLRQLHLTKPSTQNLIMASKVEQEMTGMKAGQKLLLAFAEGMFGKQPLPVESTVVETRALEGVKDG